MKVRELLRKKPFVRRLPQMGMTKVTDSLEKIYPTTMTQFWEIIPQSAFEAEYDPNGHKINSEEYYPVKI